MELIFNLTKATNFCDSGNFGSQVVAKQRVGQKSSNLTTTLKVTLPDKITVHWYTKLETFLRGINLQHCKHTVIVKDTTEFLQRGYDKIKAEQGLTYTYFCVNPNLPNLVNILGKGVIELKTLAKNKINGF
jgi:hypothetical protein